MFIQVCEKMVQRANVSWQLPVVIYRLGACSWRSTDGLGNPHDWVRCLSLLLLRSNYSNFLEFMCHVVVICHPQVTKLIAGCAHAHSAPPLHQDSLVNLAPVDKVAETFVALGAAGLFDTAAQISFSAILGLAMLLYLFRNFVFVTMSQTLLGKCIFSTK